MAATPDHTPPLLVFISSAREDETLRQELEAHLSGLRQQGLISLWHPDRVLAGTTWQEEIDAQLMRARVLLLLISPDFLASDDHYHHQMPSALARAAAQEAYVFPVLLRPVEYQGLPFAHLPILPHPALPVTMWDNRDEAFRSIVRTVHAAVEQAQAHPGPLPPLASISSRPQIFMAPDPPANFVPRPKEFRLLKQSLLVGEHDRVAAITATAALRGAGGYGKTTLAQALCQDAEIQAAFPDGILWVTLGEKTGNLIGKIEDLIYLLCRERPGFTSQEAALARLKEALADRRCLLVLDDVWHASDLRPFLQGGSHCRRLITTRTTQVLPQTVQMVPVDAMRRDEAVQLLQAGLVIEPAGQEARLIEQLAQRLGEWPLLLALANGVLRERVGRLRESLPAALTYLQRALEKRGVLAFDARNAQERREAVTQSIEVSLEQLSPDERTRFGELAIFPEDVPVPLVTVSRLWQATGNLDDLDTEDLCQRLSSFSLLQSYDLHARSIVLHDVIRGYLQVKAQAQLPALHGSFLDAYGLDRWAHLAPDEPYLWEHLAEHLLSAGRAEALLRTVQDLRYLASKALIRGTAAMERDLMLAEQQLFPNADSPVGVLRQEVAHIAHLLQRGRTLREIEEVLLSRLVHSKPLQTLCEPLSREMEPPQLVAWHPFPDLSDALLRRTLQAHTHWVWGCAVSPDGSWIVSASHDQTLKVWDATTGAVRLTLVGHSNWVRNCAMSPDGTWIVSASNDRTLKVWDATTGALRLTLAGHSNEVLGCAVSPDGTWIVSASFDQTLKVWDVHQGCCVATFFSDGALWSCALLPDGEHLVTGGERGVYFLRILW